MPKTCSSSRLACSCTSVNASAVLLDAASCCKSATCDAHLCTPHHAQLWLQCGWPNLTLMSCCLACCPARLSLKYSAATPNVTGLGANTCRHHSNYVTMHIDLTCRRCLTNAVLLLRPSGHCNLLGYGSVLMLQVFSPASRTHLHIKCRDSCQRQIHKICARLGGTLQLISPCLF